VHRAFWILLIIVAVVLIVLVAQKNASLSWLGDVDHGELFMQTVLAVFIGTIVISFFRRRWSQAILAALAWALIVMLLALGYTYRFELREIRDRVLSELVPGRTASRGRIVEVSRGGGGNFFVNSEINGVRVATVLDTGASSVVLTFDAAKAIGLPTEVLTYTVNVETANGRTRAAPVTLDRLAVGGIVEREVPALIAQRGQLRTNLLGMSFLNRLESWEVRGDRLVMRGHP
jgi:aspartyl protease family protein